MTLHPRPEPESSITGGHRHPQITTPPLTRKRKASDAIAAELTKEEVTRKSKTKKTTPTEIPTPSTPLTETDIATPRNMDSDDDMMSVGSADDLDLDDGTQASDLGSGKLFDRVAYGTN